MKPQLHRSDLIYPELSYQIIGCAFEVYNELGYGQAEKFYQKTMAVSLRKSGSQFKEEVHTPLKFQNEVMGRVYLDFLVEDKIVVELKKNARFSKSNIDQVNQYLAAGNYSPALLIDFSSDGVIHKRLVNIKT
jgi:GxxExxY protein